MARPKGRHPCTFEGCDRPNFGFGLCHSHYMQQRRGVALRDIRPARPTAAEGFLWCGRCRQFRDETEFGWDSHRDQPKRTCRPCSADAQRAFTARNRVRVNLLRRLKKRGITEAEFEALWEQQEGRCGICLRNDRPLDIDHDHETNKVRGLLCGPCNRALGFFGDDSTVVRRAVRYLSR